MENTALMTKQDLVQIATDRSCCYPAEAIRFEISFRVAKIKGVTLQVTWPSVVEIEQIHLPESVPESLPSVAEENDYIYLLIPLDQHFRPDQDHLVEVETRINTYYIDQYLHIEAELVTSEGKKLSSETSRIAVYGKSKVLKYLPELYEGNEFLSRYLMLFESFWQPLEQQSRQMHHYFDPTLTPEEFLPWLASWVGVPMDDFLPIERTRELLKSALQIYQLRGTVGSLKLFLEVFTASEVTILEQRASNFELGETNYLGVSRALGRDNQPTSIIVKLNVPKAELTRTGFARKQYQQKIEDVIRSMVPAHIIFKVQTKFVS
jgi:phage tail-like protein